MAPDDFPRDLTDRFEPIRLLGRGGMGAVFLAWERSLDRQVAIKLQQLQGGEELTARFLREGQLLARVEHRHVLQVYSVGTCEQGPYLALEYIEGRELRDVDRDVPVVDLMLDLAEGLEAVHAAGILHRDIKPSNVMVTRENRAVLVDFGLAWGYDSEMLTGTGRIVGTLGYMAPELLRGQRASPASDWFSWGVTLYSLLEGRLPYRKEQVDAAMRGDPYPGPRFQRISETGPLAVVIRAAMASDPGRRPRSRAAYEERLGDGLDRAAWDLNPSRTLDPSALAELPTPDPVEGPQGGAGVLSGAQLRSPSSVPPAERASRRGWVVLAALGFAGLGFMALRMLTPRPPPPPASSSLPDPSLERHQARRSLLEALAEMETSLERSAAWRSGDKGFPPHDVEVPPPRLLGPLGRVQARLEAWRLAGGDLAADTSEVSALRRRLVRMVEGLALQVRGLHALASIVPDQIAAAASDGPLASRPPVWDYALGGAMVSDWERIHRRTSDIAAVLEVPEDPGELEAYADGVEDLFDDHPAGRRVMAMGTPEDPAARVLADRIRPLVDGLLTQAEQSPDDQVANRLLSLVCNIVTTYLIRACESDVGSHGALAWLQQVATRLRRRVRRFSPHPRAEALRRFLERVRQAPWRRSAAEVPARCLAPVDTSWIGDLARETREAAAADLDRTKLEGLRTYCAPTPDIPDAVRHALRAACPPEEATP